MIALAARLALADYWHERLMSACAVLTLAAVLTPLLVLLGVRHGIISTLTEDLLNDPRNLEVIPAGSGKYAPDWFVALAKRPEVDFVIPQTRSIAATMDLSVPDNRARHSIVSMIPSRPDDPVLRRWAGPLAGTWSGWGGAPDVLPDGPVPVFISAAAARKTGLAAGDLARGGFERLNHGRVESAGLDLLIAGVLPLEAQQREAAYVPLALLVQAEDFRDGRQALALGWPQGPAAPEARVYPSFRLYAAGLDEVAVLRDLLQAQGLEVHTQAEAIETVRTLELGFTLVFALICGAALFGLGGSISGTALAGVMRKRRVLGIMRQLGFSRAAMLTFPLIQAVVSAFVGTLAALVMYFLVAWAINRLFSASLAGAGTVCSLTLAHVAGAMVLTLLFSLLATSGAAIKASHIEPSEVIRDV